MTHAIIGDIHGCLDEFKALVHAVHCDYPHIPIVLLGDLIDKGPSSVACVQFARDHGFHLVLGNHEEKYVRYYLHEQKQEANPKYRNPMTPFTGNHARTYGLLKQGGLLDYLSSAKPFLEVDGFVAVHGGLMPGLSLNQQPKDKILRLRYMRDGKHVPVDYNNLEATAKTPFWFEFYDQPESVVFGHEAHSLSNPLIYKSQKSGAMVYGIDTGCVHGGRLTAMITKPQVHFVQIQAGRVYDRPHLPIPP